MIKSWIRICDPGTLTAVLSRAPRLDALQQQAVGESIDCMRVLRLSSPPFTGDPPIYRLCLHHSRQGF